MSSHGRGRFRRVYACEKRDDGKKWRGVEISWNAVIPKSTPYRGLDEPPYARNPVYAEWEVTLTTSPARIGGRISQFHLKTPNTFSSLAATPRRFEVFHLKW